jgi:hypothetical protein
VPSRAPSAIVTIKATDFEPMKVERGCRVTQLFEKFAKLKTVRRAAEVAHLQYDIVGSLAVALGVKTVELATYHHRDQLVFGRIAGRDFTGILAVLHADDAVGNGHDFVEFVGDEHDCDPTLSQLLHDHEQVALGHL